MAKNTYKQDEVLEEPFDIKHLLRASSYIKKYAKRMVFAILLSGIGGASGYVVPMVIQRALDLAIPEKNERLLFSLVGMLVGIYLVSVIFTTIRSRIMVDVSQSIIYDIRKDLFAHLQENIVGARITQIFAREDENAEIFKDLSKDCRRTWNTAVRYSNLVWPGIDSISVCVRAAIFLSGLILFGQGNKSVGTIVAISSYASYFWQPIMNLGNIFNNFINNIAYLERIFETMDEPVTVKDAKDAVEMPKIRGEVTFDHVNFSYDASKQILNDVSFTVKPGESVALVGPTGAGKSTIVNLISRFYNVNGGRVLIDGQDISQVTIHSLREQMGIMMQDSFIFSGDIEDNIRYGKLDATHEEIVKASRTVCADEFISKMPDRYQTEVRERGSMLSQGQKQLISFARTLLSDPAILILDEATSSIDVQTEKALQTGLNAMLKGRTSFIIAHRLSTIRNCDKIMYIDNGGIMESGTHDELMAKKGHYYKLYTAQLDEVQKAG